MGASWLQGTQLRTCSIWILLLTTVDKLNIDSIGDRLFCTDRVTFTVLQVQDLIALAQRLVREQPETMLAVQLLIVDKLLDRIPVSRVEKAWNQVLLEMCFSTLDEKDVHFLSNVDQN